MGKNAFIFISKAHSKPLESLKDFKLNIKHAVIPFLSYYILNVTFAFKYLTTSSRWIDNFANKDI